MNGRAEKQTHSAPTSESARKLATDALASRVSRWITGERHSEHLNLNMLKVVSPIIACEGRRGVTRLRASPLLNKNQFRDGCACLRLSLARSLSFTFAILRGRHLPIYHPRKVNGLVGRLVSRNTG